MNFKRIGLLPIAVAIGLLCASAVWAQDLKKPISGGSAAGGAERVRPASGGAERVLPGSGGTNANQAAERSKDAPASRAAPTMETQVLHFNKARDAGATIKNTVETVPNACIGFGVSEGQSGSASDNTQASVVVNVNCFTCATITGEAFANFKLKNGWKIKPGGVNTATTDLLGWKYRLRPQEGTNNPHMIVELPSSNRGEVRIRIDIEGPAGTSPYIGPVL